MIWVWIAAAVFLSWILCDKHIPWYHYIWMLLPIEMYGVSVAGATLKPYMLYGFAIIAYAIIKNRGIKLPVSILIVVIFLLLSDAVNGLIMGSIMQHLMFLMILFIAFEYLIAQKKTIQLEEISKVAVATTIGYGAVFSVASILFKMGIVLPAVYTTDRYSTGMIMAFLSAGGLYSNRLRGFSIDPNIVYTTLIPGAAFALANILYLDREKRKSYLAIILYCAVVYFSGSRMGMLSFAFMLTIMFAIGYKESKNKKAWLFMMMISILGMLIIVVRSEEMIVNFFTDIYGFFTSRASLTSRKGRFGIWKTNFGYLIDNSELLFGVGQNQILNFSILGKPCHNTWLEWICGTGIFIGTGICLWFFTAPHIIKMKCVKKEINFKHSYQPVVIAYWIVVLGITSVDNITNSILLFLMVLFRYGYVETLNNQISEDNKNG